MTRLLAVDDEMINLDIMAECLSDDGYTIDQAEDGEAAWTLMQDNDYDVVVLDRMMPRLDGLSLLKRIKADERWRNLPVIMQTAAATQAQVREGLEAGAYYYLTKPYDPAALRTLVATVVSDLNERGRLHDAATNLRTALGLLDRGSFHFRTLDEARTLAAVLAGLCASEVTCSMGLVELLVNAVEHGNLGITYAEKSALRKNFGWEDEVTRRLADARWAQRKATVELRRDDDCIEFTVTDEGDGFDWQPFLEFDASRAFDLNGRGIAMARQMGFSALEYRGKGNVVVARTQAATAAPTV